MSEIIGKIEWIADAPNEYQGQMQLSIKVNGKFYNFHEPEEKLNKLATTLKKGFEVKLECDLNIIKKIEVVSDKVEEKSEGGIDDLTTFEELLEDAHKKFVTDKENMSIETEMIENDWEKQRAIFKAKVTISDGSLARVFEAYGDATQDNVGSLVKKHYIRMAETRSIARALRWATNNAKAAAEETEHGNLPDEKSEKKADAKTEAKPEKKAEAKK